LAERNDDWVFFIDRNSRQRLTEAAAQALSELFVVGGRCLREPARGFTGRQSIVTALQSYSHRLI
jgi:hypothetical protein